MDYHGETDSRSVPEEILIEILSRLPVKSLLKFRSVSRSWLRLISRDVLIKTHLANSSKNSALSKHGVILTQSAARFTSSQLNRCSLESLVSKEYAVESEFDHPGKKSSNPISVIGSVNGLVCIEDQEHIFIWNPSTRISHTIPSCAVEFPPGFYDIWGFGFNPHDGDYKVVGIFCWIGDGGSYRTVVMIYGLRSGSWKRIHGFKNGIPLDNVGKFANGKLHYPTTRTGSRNSWEIVTLDLNTERYGILEQPFWCKDECDSSIGLLDGCICVVRSFSNSHIDFWVIKEYGVRESWSKLITIPYSIGNCRGFNQCSTVPLSVLPNCEILLLFGMHFAVYDPKTTQGSSSELQNRHF